MVTEYWVCTGMDARQLQENVNEAIKNGWQPLGGIAVSVGWGGELPGGALPQLLCQAVTRSH